MQGGFGVQPLEMSKDLDSTGDFEIEPRGSPSFPSLCLGAIFFPCTLVGSWIFVQEQEEAVVLSFGKYHEVLRSSGCHFSNCVGRELRRVSKRKTSIDLPETKVVDRNGNPLLISGIVVYHIVNCKRAAIDIQNVYQFILNQSQAVMKQVVSKYPYEHLRDSEEHLPCLKTEAEEISKQLVSTLQSKVSIAGAKILSFQFNELSYAPEIAQGMLRKQQAMATVAARKTIVEGAVEIAHGALQRLGERGVKMDPSEQTRLVSNLLTVICSETDVKPTLSVNS
jgi:regulator of protease activity HflC (stomatin/prohibitin superfamily)